MSLGSVIPIYLRARGAAIKGGHDLVRLRDTPCCPELRCGALRHDVPNFVAMHSYGRRMLLKWVPKWLRPRSDGHGAAACPLPPLNGIFAAGALFRAASQMGATT